MEHLKGKDEEDPRHVIHEGIDVEIASLLSIYVMCTQQHHSTTPLFA